MQCRNNVLLRLSVLLITLAHLAASQSAATLTIPTLSASVTSIESIITSTAQEGERVGTSSVQQDEVIISTVTDESTISISTETVLVTTVSDNTVYITTSAERQTRSTSSTTIAASSAANPGDAPVLTSTANTQSEDDTATSGKHGLSAGAKAGIAVGSILGAAILAGVAYFCFKARSEARPRANTLGLDSQSRTGDNHSVPGASDRHPEGSQAESSPEQMTHPAYAAGNRLSDHMNLTGIVFEDKNDSPMYVGVPTHLTGAKRWSKSELDQQAPSY